MSQAESVAEEFRRAQERLVAGFERYEGPGRFRTVSWERDRLGFGRVRTLDGGQVFERASVNVSLVGGPEVPATIAEASPGLAGQPYRATGISMVLHPVNPYAPSFHANFRYFEAGRHRWFGGGLDLTPAYGFDEDAVHFHRTLRGWCAEHDAVSYPELKKACDEYFFIPHRGEMRGVGGVFFDRLSAEDDADHARHRAFVGGGLAAVLPAYLPIVDRRRDLPFGRRERDWQLARRGRYVEFNLVYDRGTLFGLQTAGNTEAILVSLPPLARWAFDLRPEPGSPEGATARFLRPHDWAGAEQAGPPARPALPVSGEAAR